MRLQKHLALYASCLLLCVLTAGAAAANKPGSSRAAERSNAGNRQASSSSSSSNVQVTKAPVQSQNAARQQQQQQQQQEQLQETLRSLGYADGCTPPRLPTWPVTSPKVPPLPAGRRPNFVVILADDMGWDDIGLHHPRGPDGVTSAGAQTPNIDKLIKGGMSFTNFYATPLCAMGRAELLTGRDFPRTGNLYNTRGYDAFHLGEATAGDVMQQAGYVTAHYGKWHNGQALGYEPWWRGFNESWLPTDYIHLDNLMRHNGRYVQTQGMMEQVLVDNMAGFLQQRGEDGKPFFVYYAPYAIHKNAKQPKSKVNPYFTPEPYLSRVKALQPPPDEHNAQVWAMLLYIDDVLGRLFEAVAASGLADSTYILLTADNGPALPREFISNEALRLTRMPSGMIGDKNIFNENLGSSGTEGALRNHLAISGPGVPSGAVDDTLLSLADVLPTIAELGNATDTRHMPWSGVSFANLLKPGGKASKEQQERFMFTLVTSGDKRQCPQLVQMMREMLPDVGPNREVLRPQPMLAYTNKTGGNNLKDCVVGRWKEYKWYGCSGRVFRFANGSHIELPCNEVTGAQQRTIAAAFDKQARQWWASVVAEPHSFTKQTFQLGLGGWRASNVEASGAFEISRGKVLITKPANFTAVGGNICIKVNVVTPGRYLVAAMYKSAFIRGLEADFSMTVGSHSQMQSSAAAKKSATLPALRSEEDRKRSYVLGYLDLPRSGSSGSSSSTEVCFKLERLRNTTAAAATQGISTLSTPPAGWYFYLANLRFVLQEGNASRSSLDLGEDLGADEEGVFGSEDAFEDFEDGASNQELAAIRVAIPAGVPVEAAAAARMQQLQPARYKHLAASKDMLDLERHMRKAAVSARSTGTAGLLTVGDGKLEAGFGSSSSSSSSVERVWKQLQQRHEWPDGQVVFESLYSTCNMEDMEECAEMCNKV